MLLVLVHPGDQQPYSGDSLAASSEPNRQLHSTSATRSRHVLKQQQQQAVRPSPSRGLQHAMLRQQLSEPCVWVFLPHMCDWTQVIDDESGRTLAAASTLSADVKGSTEGNGANVVSQSLWLLPVVTGRQAQGSSASTEHRPACGSLSLSLHNSGVWPLLSQLHRFLLLLPLCLCVVVVSGCCRGCRQEACRVVQGEADQQGGI